MFQKVMITGAKSSKGEMEGRPYDSTKIYVQVRMDPSKGNMVGSATEEYSWGLSDNFDKSIAFSAACDLVLKGRIQPSGYTEPLLHKKRLEKKSSN